MATPPRKTSDTASNLSELRTRLRREESARLAAELQVSKLEGRVALLEQETEKVREGAMALLSQLNKPLASVLGYSELLRRKLDAEPEARYVDVLFREAEQCAKVARKLKGLWLPADDLH